VRTTQPALLESGRLRCGPLPVRRSQPPCPPCRSPAHMVQLSVAGLYRILYVRFSLFLCLDDCPSTRRIYFRLISRCLWCIRCAHRFVTRSFCGRLAASFRQPTDLCAVLLFNVEHNSSTTNKPPLNPLQNRIVFILLVATGIFLALYDSRT
jgi:hypothetical protein